MKTLVIIESPGKKETLEKILGPDYIVRACFGHIRDLPQKELGVAPDTYALTYVELEKASKTITALAKVHRTVDRTLVATDADREGEAIAWHVGQVLGIPTNRVERMVYQEVTPAGVTAALQNVRGLNMDLVHAQECRRGLDRIIGWLASPALSDCAGLRLSAGRVQSPAVRLVVDREREIRAFTLTAYYSAELRFAGPPAWSAEWKPALPEGQKYVFDKGAAEGAAGVGQVRVERYSDSHESNAPPAAFTTSTLQQRAHAALKMKPKRTMEVAQALYDAGHITYMRTDQPNISDTGFAAIAEYCTANGLPVLKSRRQFRSKAAAQEAHEAIRPTHVENLDAGSTADEKAVYRLIWQRAVASQLEDATYAVRVAQLVPVFSARRLEFLARGRTLVKKGWRQVLDDIEDDDREERSDAANPVPTLSVGDIVDVESSGVGSHMTKAPKRYTLASLVKALEANGIGRPATYASILDGVMHREYIVEDKAGLLAAAPNGELVVDHLSKHCKFIELDYTSRLEDALDDVAQGRRSARSILANEHQQISADIAHMKPADEHACPSCSKPLRRRPGKHGPFWGCTGYPECTTALPDAGGRPGERVHTPAPRAAAPDSGHRCPKCARALRRRTLLQADDPKKKGYDFFGCSGWREGCKETFRVDSEGQPIFPEAAACAS